MKYIVHISVGQYAIMYRQWDADAGAPFISLIYTLAMRSARCPRARNEEKTEQEEPNAFQTKCPSLARTSIPVILDMNVDGVWEVSTEFFWFFLLQSISCND